MNEKEISLQIREAIFNVYKLYIQACQKVSMKAVLSHELIIQNLLIKIQIEENLIRKVNNL